MKAIVPLLDHIPAYQLGDSITLYQDFVIPDSINVEENER